jgi:hypothetical protein
MGQPFRSSGEIIDDALDPLNAGRLAPWCFSGFEPSTMTGHFSIEYPHSILFPNFGKGKASGR